MGEPICETLVTSQESTAPPPLSAPKPLVKLQEGFLPKAVFHCSLWVTLPSPKSPTHLPTVCCV